MLVKSKDIINDTVKQISDFYSGKIKALKTGKDFINDAFLGGLRPSDVLAVTSLPFMGKTYLLEEITMFLEKEYPNTIFVHSRWEIELNKSIVRELSKGTGKTVKEVLNVPPDKETKQKYTDLLKKYRQDNIYIQNPCTVDEFEEDLKKLIEEHKDKVIFWSVDNIENLVIDGQNQKSNIDNLLQVINVYKKKHPFIVFVLLNQLNRNLSERTDNPKSHFPRESDIYSSSQMFKLADVVICLNNPYKIGLDKYSVFSTQHRFKYIPDEFKNVGGNTSTFKTEGLLFYHILKQRNVPEQYDPVDLYVHRLYEIPQQEENKVAKPVAFDY